MSLAFFSVKNQWHKNGIWWFSKILNRIVGQSLYDSLRIRRRVISNKFYYYRQQMLYQCFVQSPDVACMLGIYPKIDSSHGWAFYNTYEMYRDFQQNTINSDGSFSMWVVYLAVLYTIHQIYNYFIPWYWYNNYGVKNSQQARFRMRDAIASTVMEDATGMQLAEWGWMPHDFHALRRRLTTTLSHPDDIRAMHMSALNRKFRYVEHYTKRIGDENQVNMIAK